MQEVAAADAQRRQRCGRRPFECVLATDQLKSSRIDMLGNGHDRVHRCHTPRGEGGRSPAKMDHLLVQAHAHVADWTTHKVGNLDKEFMESVLHCNPVGDWTDSKPHPHFRKEKVSENR